MKKFMSLILALGMLLTVAVTSVSAAEEASKSTPYGTLEGFQSNKFTGFSDHWGVFLFSQTVCSKDVSIVTITLSFKNTNTGAQLRNFTERADNYSWCGWQGAIWHDNPQSVTKMTGFGAHQLIQGNYSAVVYTTQKISR